jgi:hypothetical protein
MVFRLANGNVARVKGVRQALPGIVFPSDKPIILSCWPGSDSVSVGECAQPILPRLNFFSFESLAEVEVVSLSDKNCGGILTHAEFQKVSFSRDYLSKRSLGNGMV